MVLELDFKFGWKFKASSREAIKKGGSSAGSAPLAHNASLETTI
jgi:hypothetical protein